MGIRERAFVLAVLGYAAAGPLRSQTVVFDFDSGTPALARGQTTPFDQTSGGVTASFSSLSGGYSIQNDSSTGLKMTRFSSNYLYPISLMSGTLDIKFSRQLTAITLTFATADFQQAENPTPVRLTALQQPDGTTIGTVTVRGSYVGDSMPVGTLSFQSSGQTFNAVQIVIPPQPLAASNFLVDNVVVTPAAAGSITSVSAASYASGAPLAPGAIASGFGQGLAAGSESAASLPLPTTLANTTVSVKDSAGIERPAPLFFAGPSQINYVVPEGTALGPATLTVTSGGLATATGSVVIDRVAPALFTANLDGKGPPAAFAVALAPDQTQTTQDVALCGPGPGSCVTSPIDLGPAGTQVALTLYGTGIRGRTALTAVTAKIGGVDAPVSYAGAQPEFAGLDQVNVTVPGPLAGRGEMDLVITVEGKAANTVRVNIK